MAVKLRKKTGANTFADPITLLESSDISSWAKASSKPSYSWSEITGKPSTFTPASHTHNYLPTTNANYNTNTKTNYFKISRNGGDKECLSIGVDDNEVLLDFLQDETIANFTFVGRFDDSESGGGAAAGSHTFKFNSSSSGASITIDGTAVSLNGHTHSYNDLTNKPTIPSYSAGTGLTLSNNQFSVSSANASTILNLLSTGSMSPTDNDYYISQYVGGGTTTTSYHRRPMSALWSYVKGKADSVYQPKGTYATESYVDTAIANAITTALNTAV